MEASVTPTTEQPIATPTVTEPRRTERTEKDTDEGGHDPIDRAEPVGTEATTAEPEDAKTTSDTIDVTMPISASEPRSDEGNGTASLKTEPREPQAPDEEQRNRAETIELGITNRPDDPMGQAEAAAKEAPTQPAKKEELKIKAEKENSHKSHDRKENKAKKSRLRENHNGKDKEAEPQKRIAEGEDQNAKEHAKHPKQESEHRGTDEEQAGSTTTSTSSSGLGPATSATDTNQRQSEKINTFLYTCESGKHAIRTSSPNRAQGTAGNQTEPCLETVEADTVTTTDAAKNHAERNRADVRNRTPNQGNEITDITEPITATQNTNRSTADDHAPYATADHGGTCMKPCICLCRIPSSTRTTNSVNAAVWKSSQSSNEPTWEVGNSLISANKNGMTKDHRRSPSTNNQPRTGARTPTSGRPTRRKRIW